VRDDATVEKVAGLLRRLPLKNGAEQHIPMAALILVEWARLPRGRPTRGDKAAVRELAKVAKHLREALSVIENLSAEASYELGNVPLDANDVLLHSLRTRDVPRLVANLEKRALLAKEWLETKSSKRPARRPENIAARLTAVALLGFYEEFTGNKATVTVYPNRDNARGGMFVDLVADVFEVLGIRASPSSQAVAAIKRDAWRFDMDFDEFVALLTRRESRKGLAAPAP
jgi:hypothetical protein